MAPGMGKDQIHLICQFSQVDGSKGWMVVWNEIEGAVYDFIVSYENVGAMSGHLQGGVFGCRYDDGCWGVNCVQREQFWGICF